MMTSVLRRGGGWLLFLLVLAGEGYAQADAEPQEITVFLKDGTVVQGMTTLSMFEGYLTVEHDAFNQTHVLYTDIEQVVFGKVSVLEREKIEKSRKKRKPFSIKERGYFSMIDLGILNQRGGHHPDYRVGGGRGPSITIVNGYALNPHLRLGVGVGLEGYGYNNVSTVPVFLSVSGLMNRRRWAPYYFLNAGGSAAAWMRGGGWGGNYDVRGGAMVHPGLGYRYHLGKKALSFALGYKVQRARLRYDWDEWNGVRVEVSERRTFRRLSITMGFHF